MNGTKRRLTTRREYAITAFTTALCALLIAEFYLFGYGSGWAYGGTVFAAIGLVIGLSVLVFSAVRSNR